MSKFFVVITSVLAITACSGDPHELGSCDSTWRQNGATACEAACEEARPALNASGSSCTAETSAGAPFTCTATFEWEDIRGCCSRAGTTVNFAECE